MLAFPCAKFFHSFPFFVACHFQSKVCAMYFSLKDVWKSLKRLKAIKFITVIWVLFIVNVTAMHLDLRKNKMVSILRHRLQFLEENQKFGTNITHRFSNVVVVVCCCHRNIMYFKDLNISCVAGRRTSYTWLWFWHLVIFAYFNGNSLHSTRAHYYYYYFIAIVIATVRWLVV